MNNQRLEWPDGVKRTKQRECLLTALECSDKPLSALGICEKMQRDGMTASLSTVYRILDFFEGKGLVNKIMLMNSDMSLYELNRNKHRHFAVCLHCNKIIEMEHCPLEASLPELENGNFTITGHNLEIYGVCRECSLRSNAPVKTEK